MSCPTRKSAEVPRGKGCNAPGSTFRTRNTATSDAGSAPSTSTSRTTWSPLLSLLVLPKPLLAAEEDELEGNVLGRLTSTPFEDAVLESAWKLVTMWVSSQMKPLARARYVFVPRSILLPPPRRAGEIARTLGDACWNRDTTRRSSIVRALAGAGIARPVLAVASKLDSIEDRRLRIGDALMGGPAVEAIASAPQVTTVPAATIAAAAAIAASDSAVVATVEILRLSCLVRRLHCINFGTGNKCRGILW
mmetsp:Transcript_3538/g.6841  ORF Transcript_3538/g.6841 Transcript_3538/m.6841 type:complete len:249 (-) Transcript_3538:74-820(-)